MIRQHDEMLELAALHGLGVLSPDEMGVIATHMCECAECRSEFADAAAAATALGYSVATAPPAALRERVLQIARSRFAAPVPPLEPKAVSVPFWRRWPVATATAAAAVVAIAIGLPYLWHNPRPPAEPTGPVARVMKSWPASCNPRKKPCAINARVIAAAPATLRLVAQGLKQLPSGRVYQAWTIRPGSKKPIPQPTFVADPAGRATVAIPAKVEKGLIVAVTVEPEGGSTSPTTTPFLVAALR